MMKGYYNNPELTRTVIRNGWYYTGDIGFLDEQGYLHLVTRKKDMIISGGENVYPQEIAACIQGMGDEIADVAVIGTPDPYLGESAVAAVVLQEGGRITEKEIIDCCREKLGRYFKPRRVCFLPALPRGENGKIMREDLLPLLMEENS
jgi:long-chain acyl-CoA synthetase